MSFFHHETENRKLFLFMTTPFLLTETYSLLRLWLPGWDIRVWKKQMVPTFSVENNPIFDTRKLCLTHWDLEKCEERANKNPIKCNKAKNKALHRGRTAPRIRTGLETTSWARAAGKVLGAMVGSMLRWVNATFSLEITQTGLNPVGWGS